MKPVRFWELAADVGSRKEGSPWIGLAMGLIMLLVGGLGAVNFRKIPSRVHDLLHRRVLHRRVPPGSRQAAVTSFEFQRIVAGVLACVGIVLTVVSGIELAIS